MSDDIKESVQACERFSNNARKKAVDMDCGELLDKISELCDREKSGRMGTKGLLQRFRDYLGDDATHGPAILDQQRSLRTYMDEFDNKGCGDPPAGAPELADRPLPLPDTPAVQPGTAKLLLMAGGTAGLGYVGYRIFRFLPSLAPPLWGTIPANLAIP